MSGSMQFHRFDDRVDLQQIVVSSLDRSSALGSRSSCTRPLNPAKQWFSALQETSGIMAIACDCAP